MIKLPNRSVFEYDKAKLLVKDDFAAELESAATGDKPNPNSCCFSYFQTSEKTYQRSALMRILFELLKEPCFNQLRTQEQLGYIVDA